MGWILSVLALAVFNYMQQRFSADTNWSIAIARFNYQAGAILFYIFVNAFVRAFQ